MIGDFFIWCAGSDANVLSKCEDSVRTKHIGLGTLVLIPAVLGFISMSYALSTIPKISLFPFSFTIGGLIWGLIVFAFDRFIVSTHRKKPNNYSEFFNLTFYLRLIFAFVLGVVVSHPFVLLYFDSSITEKIISDRDNAIQIEDSKFQKDYDNLTLNLRELTEKKRCNESLLTAEQSGNKLVLPCGSSSGIPNISGSFPRTKEIKTIILGLEKEIAIEQLRIDNYTKELRALKETKQENIEKNTSFDYLKRETALTKLKKEDSIISITEFFIMLAFMLVDILPLIFKTFSPFSMYDKILCDDVDILKDINIESRRNALQKAYDKISSVYTVSKNLDNSNEYKDYIASIKYNLNLQTNIAIGLFLGIIIAIGIYYFGNLDIENSQLLNLTTISSIILSIIASSIWDLMKYFYKNSNKENL